MGKIRVLLGEDHTLVADGLARLIEPEFDLVAKADNGRAAVQAAAQHRPDVVLLDISMPLLNGIEAARQIRAESPQTKIVFLTMHTDLAYVAEALRAGASGYLLKRSAVSELSAAIRAAVSGKVYITPQIASRLKESARPETMASPRLTGRQREVLQLIAEGFTAKEMASQLSISTKTVEFHRAAILQKLGLHGTADLIRYALEHHISGNRPVRKT
ncbi:MAG: response regulator transcription factor [Bryobacteraceae bacterium]